MMKDKREWYEVTSIADIPSNRPLEAIVGDTVIILLKVGDDVMAYQGLCPHQFARLSQGTIAGDSLHCPRHKASFDIHDGTCGPGWQLPALRQYHVRVKAGVVSLAYPLAVKAGHD
ncbi:Rieske (2Fe-2S) protein [uncultured Sneathiella sp.]|uniref:Rieske (2Fe-2S) protein n=1 Tax=uncultured Sneathiella sp. TaxID=879315 RepID=UPI0030EF3319